MAAATLALSAYREALKGQPPTEVRRRLEGLIERQSQEWRRPSPDTLRTLRAVEALELAGTRQARQLLEVLAKGAAETRLTQQSQSALERLAQRAVQP